MVLIPLGDDFRYTSDREAQAQYTNYEKLMSYMNSRADMNVNVQFGTLKDYFNLVRQKKPITKMPVLSGDFFTYADRNDHYWSGYYTSRPLYKRLGRTVEYYLRTAEILFSFANLNSLKTKKTSFNDQLYKKLLKARRNLGLFQHHDGITGTAKTAVNDDYGAKLLESIKNSQLIIKDSIEFLLSGGGDDKKDFLMVDDSRLVHDTLTTRTVLDFDRVKERRVYVFNSNEHKRIEIVTIHIDTPFVELYDDKDGLMSENYQINLLWSRQQADHVYLEHEENVYELLVQVELNPFEIKSIKIKASSQAKTSSSTAMARNTFLINNDDISQSKLDTLGKSLEEKGLSKDLVEFIKFSDQKTEIMEVNAGRSFKACFDTKTGLLKKLSDKKSGEDYKLNVRVVHYGTTSKNEKSGGRFIFN